MREKYDNELKQISIGYEWVGNTHPQKWLIASTPFLNFIRKWL